MRSAHVTAKEAARTKQANTGVLLRTYSESALQFACAKALLSLLLLFCAALQPGPANDHLGWSQLVQPCQSVTISAAACQGHEPSSSCNRVLPLPIHIIRF
jgi:hypothetical protein